MTHEITKLIKYSPHQEGILKELKSVNDVATVSHSPGEYVLRPTRWTVRADSFASIIGNYAVLQSTWEEATRVARDTETKASIGRVSALMKTFDFLFGVVLGEMLLRHQATFANVFRRSSTFLLRKVRK